MAPAPRPIVVAANSAWNIVNFRAGLVRALREKGYEPVVVAPHDPAFDEQLAGLGVQRLGIRIDRSGLNPLADFGLLIRYRQILRQLRPTAFLGFTIKPNIYGSLAAAATGISAIPNVSGLGTAFMKKGPLQRLVRGLYRLAFRQAPVVFFQNPDDRDLFIQRDIIRPEQARVLPGSGIDLERFAPSPQPAGPVTFLLIARLLGDKGLREYVEAARQVCATLPEAQFQLLGPIDEGNRTAIRRAELDRWIEEGVVDYLGTSEDVRPAIAAASAVVLPSYREGLPRTLLEGGAMARPLITTDVPGCRGVVDEGVNGYFCSVRDARSLAEAMMRFAKLSLAERQAMGAASRRKVQERFSEDVVIGAYLDELARL